MAFFFARRTMFSIIAPELKSLKYRISLSPDGVRDLQEPVLVGSARTSARSVVSIIRKQACCASPPSAASSSGWIGTAGSRYFAMMSLAPCGVRALDLDLHVQPARAAGWPGRSCPRGSRRRSRSRSSGSRRRRSRTSSCGTIVFSTSRGDAACPRVRNSESISSKNTMTGKPSALRSLARWKISADLALGLADVLVQQLGALDVQEVGLRASLAPVRSATCWASELATAFAMSVLPQPGGPYSRTPFGGLSWCSCEQLRVQERQLDRVADVLDLAARGRRCPRSVMSGISSRTSSSTSSFGELLERVAGRGSSSTGRRRGRRAAQRDGERAPRAPRRRGRRRSCGRRRAAP